MISLKSSFFGPRSEEKGGVAMITHSILDFVVKAIVVLFHVYVGVATFVFTLTIVLLALNRLRER